MALPHYPPIKQMSVVFVFLRFGPISNRAINAFQRLFCTADSPVSPVRLPEPAKVSLHERISRAKRFAFPVNVPVGGGTRRGPRPAARPVKAQSCGDVRNRNEKPLGCGRKCRGELPTNVVARVHPKPLQGVKVLSPWCCVLSGPQFIDRS